MIYLDDGSLFIGDSFAQEGEFYGELVFNTAMTGYQECITDPSYKDQIILFTTPHIGVVGVNDEDAEAEQIACQGIITKAYSRHITGPRGKRPLHELLIEQGKFGITNVDTRAICHILRTKGCQGCFIKTNKWHVAVIDYGVKKSILQKLEEHHCQVTLVGPDVPFSKLLALGIDGVVVSNGPGDPASYDTTTIKQLLDAKIPLFGICLGHQLLALAAGAATVKLTAGHHGINHPVLDLATKRIFITSQNHNFVVATSDLFDVTHRSLFDNTIAGIRHKEAPAFGFQGHPEASCGPHDALSLFTQFIGLLCQSKKRASLSSL